MQTASSCHRTPAWLFEENLVRVLAHLEDLADQARQIPGDPGPWTARLCRYINGLPENRNGVIYCGLCIHYANPRKRARAGRLPQLLPGFSEGAYQLHPACARIPLRQLQTLLRALERLQLVQAQPLTRIPDSRNHRGWDFATVWRVIE